MNVIARLMTFKNVLITSHQAFLTHEALQEISETTIHNLDCWERGAKSEFELCLIKVNRIAICGLKRPLAQIPKIALYPDKPIYSKPKIVDGRVTNERPGSVVQPGL